MFVIPALCRLRQKYCEFQFSWSYIAKPEKNKEDLLLFLLEQFRVGKFLEVAKYLKLLGKSEVGDLTLEGA
jgi:hypothetical protein